MSYKKKLGKVKGEQGTTYTPHITNETDENGILKQYISWTSSDESEIPSALLKTEIPIQAYIPTITSEGKITFRLGTPTNVIIDDGISIKGPQGDSGAIRCIPVDSEPTYGEQGVIYVWDENAWVFDENGNAHQIENALRFDNYYTKSETYKKYDISANANELGDMTYSAETIDAKLGRVEDAINIIDNMLDNGSIIIPTDDD